MQLFSWLHKRMTGRLQTRCTAVGKPTPRCRPQVEMLERRDLPSFSAPVAYALWQPATTLVAADVNGDGKPDLISLLNNGISAVAQLNQGNGTFGPAQNVNNYGGTASAMAVSNNGGLIVFANTGGGFDDTFVVLLNNGQGSFTYRSTSYTYTAAPVSSVALADLYGDGELDLVAAITGDYGSVYVARGPGTNYDYGSGTYYDVPAADAVGGGPLHLALGDLNGDGKTDIVAAGCGCVTVFLNNGNGTFGAPQTYAVAGSPTSAAVGDFNKDGKLDIVTANANGTVSLLLNNGNGTFGAPQNYAVGGPANSVAVGDFDRDGFLDVVTTGAEMDLLQNNGNGTFGAYQKVGPGGSNVVASDFVSPGYSDLAQFDASGNNIDVLLNNADPMPPPAHVSPSFGSITYSHKTKLYSETVTLTNDGGTTLTGPSSLELTNLPTGVVLTDATGTLSGNPYIRFLSSGKTLKPGASLTITLTFTAPSLGDIVFDTEVVAF
jgi:hypothetical protein